MPQEIKFDNIPIGYSLDAGKPGDQVSVSFMEFSSSEDGDHFIQRLDGFPNEVLGKLSNNRRIAPSMIDHMLVVIRSDKTATAYINELNIFQKIQPKRDLKAGEPVYTNDIADINEINFGEVTVPDDAGVLFLFSVGWRKGLYFDLSPIHPKEPAARDYNLGTRLAHFYTYLSFQNRFKITDNGWDKIFAQAWFPFISLSVDSIINIINYAKNGWSIDELLPQLADEVQNNLDSWFKKWQKNDFFSGHIALLTTAVERFTHGDYASCVSIIYPRIEGIMRAVHVAEGSKKKATQDRLISSVLTTINSESNPKLLLFPEKFRSYLTDVYFADFDPSDPKGVSRHTVSHGVAPIEKFNEKSAVVGLLIIDQISFYLSGRKNSDKAAAADR